MTSIAQKWKTLIVVLGALAFAALASYRLPASMYMGVALSGVVMAVVVAERKPESGAPEYPAAEAGQQASRRRRRVVVIGTGTVGRTLARELKENPGFDFVGFIDDDLHGREPEEGRILGDRGLARAVIRKYHVDEVIVAYAPTWQQKLADELMADRGAVKVRVVPSAYEAMLRLRDVESLGDIALVRLAPRTCRIRDGIKRTFDVCAAAFGLVVLSPLMCLVAAATKLTSRGPIVFAQERVGFQGRSFILYKFRTMRVDAEAVTGPVLSAGKYDERLTPLGRWLRMFRVDEIPQLWNVLMGEMSLVGPRPERPHFVRKYENLVPAYAKRHEVRPGITGLAQVCGGYHTDPRDKLRFDLIYVSHQSILLDLSILLRTVLVVCLPSRPTAGK